MPTGVPSPPWPKSIFPWAKSRLPFQWDLATSKSDSLNVEFNGSNPRTETLKIGARPQVRLVSRVEALQEDNLPLDRRYASAKQCIYCGQNDNELLTDEHIVPYALDGLSFIPNGSCRQCAEKTSLDELRVLRGPMRAIRIRLKMRSRKKHSTAAKTQRIELFVNEEWRKIDVPLEDYPLFLHFLILPKAQYFQTASTASINIVGIESVIFGGARFDIFKKRFGARQVRFRSIADHPIPFARMIAKIAYCAAVAQGKISLIQDSKPVVAAILGHTNDIGRYVGSASEEHRKYKRLLHRVNVAPDNERGLLIANVQLFSETGAPSYKVVLGQLL